MNLAISRIKEIIPYFNEKPLTENDFWQICEREQIQVVETNLVVNGFYYEGQKRKIICLNKALQGLAWLESAFHELAHYFLHAPPPHDRQEREARAIALIAILPRTDLEKTGTDGLDEYSEYAGRIVAERFEVLEKHGL